MTTDHSIDPVTSESAPSRTQRKRAARDLQKIGQRLVELDRKDLARLPLPDQITDAIGLYGRIHSREARRRQLQFLGKLMRRIDTAPIEAALARLDGTTADARFAFQQLETWRERLLEDPGALTEYLTEHPNADRQALRHQLKRTHGAKNDAMGKTEARALFRLLKTFADSGFDQGSSH
jgi:ribosome-associated protein